MGLFCYGLSLCIVGDTSLMLNVILTAKGLEGCIGIGRPIVSFYFLGLAHGGKGTEAVINDMFCTFSCYSLDLVAPTPRICSVSET